MKTICLYFQVHQPMRLRRYRFFDIGNSHYYYDDYSNESIMQKVTEKCYLPANKLFLELIKEYGCQIKLNFSITGIAIDQMELYAPEVLDSFIGAAFAIFMMVTVNHMQGIITSRDQRGIRTAGCDPHIAHVALDMPLELPRLTLIG